MEYWTYKILLILTSFVAALTILFLLFIPLSLLLPYSFLILGWYFGPLFLLQLPLLAWMLANSRSRKMDLVKFLNS